MMQTLKTTMTCPKCSAKAKDSRSENEAILKEKYGVLSPDEFIQFAHDLEELYVEPYGANVQANLAFDGRFLTVDAVITCASCNLKHRYTRRVDIELDILNELLDVVVKEDVKEGEEVKKDLNEGKR